ncbi:MAG: hypothetical protein IKM73_14455 [Acidaminococcaceae bacterium]|nr:hypothetical protein [Oscillospiraceae bacterium]MBR6862513.1 hypothetical protein [Acidaminococcaceae bacterium]
MTQINLSSWKTGRVG